MQNNKTFYIFNAIAVIILLGSVGVFKLFEYTKQNIENTAINSQISHIDNITNNISNYIIEETDGQIYQTLKANEHLRKHIEEDLRIFVTKRYKYIYIVDKEKNSTDQFRFLLDTSKDTDDKSEFEEPYTPLRIDSWNNVYKNKKAQYFKHTHVKNVWITYLKPIIIDSKVRAIIVVDFSLEISEIILSSLQKLSTAIHVVLFFSIIIFFVIASFSYLDKKREKAKMDLYHQLEEKTEKISQFNKTLEHRVKDEVAKNREKDKRLLQQSRLAQMGELISMIAHQWRQPLSAISNTSAAISIKAQLGKLEHKTAIELADKISGYTQHLSTTIDDFRAFVKKDKEKTETSFSELLQSVFNIIEASIKNKNITLIQEIDSSEKFTSYPNELKQVILNLIKNAEDVLIENNIENPYIKIATYKENETNILVVSDNGGGIGDDIIEKIFDPYFSTKEQKNGTGLGLYMSKTIIEDHCKGKLSACNDEFGAVFKITI